MNKAGRLFRMSLILLKLTFACPALSLYEGVGVVFGGAGSLCIIPGKLSTRLCSNSVYICVSHFLRLSFKGFQLPPPPRFIIYIANYVLENSKPFTLQFSTYLIYKNSISCLLVHLLCLCVIFCLERQQLSEIVVQLVRASLPGVCRAECPGFEPRSDLKLFINKFHLVLYQFALKLSDSSLHIHGIVP